VSFQNLFAEWEIRPQENVMNRKFVIAVGTLALMALPFASPLAAQNTAGAAAKHVCIYANDNVSTNNTVEGYLITPTTSTHIAPVATGGAGLTQGTLFATPLIALGPKSTNLYAADITSNDIALFSINSASCQITHVANFPVGSPKDTLGSIVISPNGKFLYADENLNNDPQVLVVMPINSDGTLGSPIQTVDGGGIAAMAISPDGNTLVVSEGDFTMASYAVNVSTGTLTSASTVNTTNTTTGVAIDPQSKFVYVGAGQKGLIIQAVEIGPGSVLTFVSEQEFGFSDNSNCLLVSPDGKFLYVSNQNASSVTTFSIDSQNAQLTMQGAVSDDPPFNAPALMSIIPNGEGLFVGGGTLGVYKSNLGDLTSLGTFPFTGSGQHNSIVGRVF
jgi:6-phosphogluconolactonase (cycloisomerase 2 family)